MLNCIENNYYLLEKTLKVKIGYVYNIFSSLCPSIFCDETGRFWTFFLKKGGREIPPPQVCQIYGLCVRKAIRRHLSFIYNSMWGISLSFTLRGPYSGYLTHIVKILHHCSFNSVLSQRSSLTSCILLNILDARHTFL